MKRTTVAVWLEKHQRWQIKVQKNGVRKTFTCSTPGKKGQRKCHQKADDWLDDNLDRTGTRLGVLYDEWIEELKLLTGTDHWQQYERYGRLYIKKKIGKVKMGDITEQHLQQVINSCHKKGLAKKTLSNIKACMTAFIKFGRKCRATTLIVENLVVPRNAPVKERTILQPDDLKVLFQKDSVVMYNKEMYDLFVNAYRFEVTTGLRPGEIVGLKWDDIQENVIHLKRSINIHNETTQGKNLNAQRIFVLKPIDQMILDKQKEKLQELGINSIYVFPSKDGDYIPQSTYAKRWTRYRDQAGLAKATPYELRHTFVSVVKQLPVGLIKPLVGHSQSMDTFGTYGHELTGEMQLTAQMIHDIFESYLK